MRKHSARKWLHFILDLLPVIILPVFALYEINHDQNTPIEVTAEESVLVDFNQLAKYSNGTLNGLTLTNVDDNYMTISGSVTSLPSYNQLQITDNIEFKRDGSKYLIRFDSSSNLSIGVRGYSSSPESYIWSSYADTNWNYGVYIYLSLVGQSFDVNDLQLNIVNLTQMFGRGNEPTISQFETLYPSYFSGVVESDRQFVDGNIVVYNNTDIGSQMMYALYKPVKEYFNFNNVFNFGDIYQWFELNIFGGTAPMSFFIVWNIILYQFVMDLVFLIYGLFMWFIDMCEKLMDKPLNSIN